MSSSCKRRVGLTLLFAGLLVLPSRGQVPDDSTVSAGADSVAEAAGESTDWLVLPFLSYAPSTQLAGGVVAGMYLPPPPDGRPSSVEVTLKATQRRQFTVQVEPELYPAGGRWRVNGELLLSKYPNVFYGIGGDTPASAEEAYTARYGSVDASAERRARPNLRVGPRLFARYGVISDVDTGGLIDQGRVPGFEGGFEAGLGLSTVWDDRNSIYYPTEGSYAEAIVTWYSDAWESDHTFGHLIADLRGYRSIGFGSIAAQVYGEAVVGTAPFQLLPMLGGADRMRGYREGRFRDDLYWTLQMEYRFPLFWRLKGVVFGAAGEVGPRIGSDIFRGIETALGAGGRFRLTDGGVHGRLDLAYSKSGVELYLALGEAF